MTRMTSPFGCPMDALLRVLMGAWTTYLLWVLRSNGPTRFGELRRKMPGISAKVLTERLRMLVDSGIVHRERVATIPPQVTYSLSPRGEELREVLDMLNGVAIRWQQADAADEAGRATAGASAAARPTAPQRPEEPAALARAAAAAGGTPLLAEPAE